MSTLPKSRIRIAADLFQFGRLTDVLRPHETNQFEEQIPIPPKFRGGDCVQIEVGIFNNNALVTNLSAIAKIHLTIKPVIPQPADAIDVTQTQNPDERRGPASNVAPILTKTLAASAFTAITQAQWDSKEADKAHAILTLSSAETALAPGERWLSLIAEDDSGEARTLASGIVLILGGGPTHSIS